MITLVVFAAATLLPWRASGATCTFAPAVNYATGNSPNSVAVGDVNRDGKLDLAITNGLSNTVSILLGNGNGTFAAAVNFGTAAYPAGVVIADANG